MTTRNRIVNVANPSDRDWTRHSYLLWFGACAPTYVLTYANGLDDALETAAEWLAENAPGLILPHDGDELADLIAEAAEDHGGTSDDFHAGWNMYATSEQQEWSQKVEESATADLTYTESGYLTSYEWWVNENPSKGDLIALYKRLANK